MMPVMDEIKRKTEEGLKTLKEVAQDIAHSLEVKAKITKKKYVDITRIKREIREAYAQIGEYVYDQYLSGRQIDMETPFVKERIEEIERGKRRIKELEEEIEELRKAEVKDNP